jgi:MFS transporter, DHA2 family, multidrug resistance protein
MTLLTTLLAQREAFHRAPLTEKLVVNDPLTLERARLYTQKFVSSGFSLAETQNKALGLIDSIVNQQSAVLSFADTFWAVAALVLVCLPLVLLLGRPAQGIKVDLGH